MFKVPFWVLYWVCKQQQPSWVESSRITYFFSFYLTPFYVLQTIMLSGLVLLFCNMVYYIEWSVLAEQVTSMGSILENLDKRAALNPIPQLAPEHYEASFYLPSDHYQRGLMRAFYKGGIDPIFSRVYQIFNSNEKYFVYWYLLYNGNLDIFLKDIPNYTELDVHKFCLEHISPRYIVNIVEAAKYNFSGYSTTWVPPVDYLHMKPWHPWLTCGPNFIGPIPVEYFNQLSASLQAGSASTIDVLAKQGDIIINQPAKFYFPVTPDERSYFIGTFKPSMATTYEKLQWIFTTNLKYLLFQYVSYCDIVLRAKPIWTESELLTACLELQPDFIFHVCEVGKNNMPNYTAAWQPAENYLVTKQYQPWFSLVKNFTGAVPSPNDFLPMGAYQRELLEAFYLSKYGNSELYHQLYHMFTSNERHLVYWYFAYHDLALHSGPWTIDDMHKVCLDVDPQLIFDVVNTGKSLMPGFNAEWLPDPEYLELKLWSPWLDFGPSLMWHSRYIFAALMLVFMSWWAATWSIFPIHGNFLDKALGGWGKDDDDDNNTGGE